MHPRVVNVRAAGARWDIYVGRGQCPLTGVRPGWGNPYRVADHGEDALTRYLDYLALRPSVVERVRDELRGLVLGCWCAPHPCHAEVLARLADGETLERIRADWLARPRQGLLFRGAP